MRKKVAIVLMLIGLFGIEAKAYDFAIRLTNGDSLFFNVTDVVAHHVAVVPPVKGGTNCYYRHRQPSGAVIIPAKVINNGQEYVVTAIGERAFSGCTKVQLVTMPETVTQIGAYAFYGCTGIKGRVSIGVNVKSIGASAFYGCSSLSEVLFRARECEFMGGSMSMTVFGNCRNLRKVLVDRDVRRIPDYAFCGVDAIVDSISLPVSLQYIGKYAFAYCSSLSGSVVIPDSVETVGECAFHQCHALKGVTIGANVKQIGGRAFYHCVGLKRVKVNALYPPEIAVTTFSDIPKTVKISVPCVSKSLYTKSGFWKRLGNYETFGNCTFSVVGTMDNPQAGVVMGSGEYGFGDSVKLAVVCAAGYGFDGWSDGNRENPRVLVPKGSESFVAVTRPSGTIHIIDTIYRIDTVYAEGYKVIHDTVDIVEVAKSINGLKEVEFDKDSKRLKWNFPRSEKVVSVTLFNQSGECVYTGDGRKGRVNMRRHPSGSYIVRIETVRRVIRCRFFMSSDGAWGSLDRAIIAQ